MACTHHALVRKENVPGRIVDPLYREQPGREQLGQRAAGQRHGERCAGRGGRGGFADGIAESRGQCCVVGWTHIIQQEYG